MRRCELHHRQQPEEQSGQHRDAEREEKDQGVDPDFRGARQAVRCVGDERADARVGEPEADDAAGKGEGHAFRQQFPGDPAGSRAERGVDRQLLLPRFGSDQEQVGDVRAGDEQNEADSAEEHPQHATDISDDIGRERPDVRSDLHVVEHLAREAGWHRKAIRDERNQPRNVGVRLLHRDAGLQPRHAPIAEVGRVQLRTVEAERQNQLRVAIEEAEPGGKHADDLARLAVDDDRFAEDTPDRCRTSVSQYAWLRITRSGVFGESSSRGEMAAEDRVDVEEAQRAVRHEQDLHALGLAGAGDRNGAAVPQPDVLEYTPLFPVR